jgi:hypothetical protein
MSNTASALWASIVRTIVPIVVGSVIAWLVRLGITLDKEFETLLTALLTGGLTAIYYVAVRLLETYVTPKFGWLLGFAKAPAVYSSEGPDVAAARLVSAANGRHAK